MDSEYFGGRSNFKIIEDGYHQIIDNHKGWKRRFFWVPIAILFYLYLVGSCVADAWPAMGSLIAACRAGISVTIGVIRGLCRFVEVCIQDLYWTILWFRVVGSWDAWGMVGILFGNFIMISRDSLFISRRLNDISGTWIDRTFNKLLIKFPKISPSDKLSDMVPDPLPNEFPMNYIRVIIHNFSMDIGPGPDDISMDLLLLIFIGIRGYVIRIDPSRFRLILRRMRGGGEILG